MMPVKRVSRQKKYLVTPTPPRKSKVSGARPKPCGRVLTSAKSIELVEEKERKKQEKINKKEKRRHLREENKRNKDSKSKAAQKLEGSSNCYLQNHANN